MKKTEYYLLKSVNQYVDLKGNIYDVSPNGNIDDTTIPTLGNITNAPQSWWNHLSVYDIKITDIIFGELSNDTKRL